MAARTKILDQVTAPFGPTEDTVDGKGARVIAAAYGLAGVVLGSVVARSRAAKGHEPIAKVFF